MLTDDDEYAGQLRSDQSASNSRVFLLLTLYCHIRTFMDNFLVQLFKTSTDEATASL